MTDRVSSNSITQIGMESTPGTTVPATKLLDSLVIVLGAEIEVAEWAAHGRRFENFVEPGKEWTSSKVTGKATYTEMVYPASMIFGDATITTPGGGTTSRQWLWTPPLTGGIVPHTATVEYGSAVQAEKAGYGFLTDFHRSGDRTTSDFDGAFIGQQITTGITLTPSLSPVSEQPVLSKHMSCYMDTTSGGIGGTQLLRQFKYDFSYGGAFTTFWPLNRSLASFGGIADMHPKTELKITIEADATGMGLIPDMRLGNTKYIRLQSLGAVIESAIQYEETLDMACKITKIGPPQDFDGLEVVEYTFAVVEDIAWGKAFSYKLVNTLTAL